MNSGLLSPKFHDDWGNLARPEDPLSGPRGSRGAAARKDASQETARTIGFDRERSTSAHRPGPACWLLLLRNAAANSLRNSCSARSTPVAGKLS